MDIPPQGLTTSDLREIHIRWDDDLHKLVAGIFRDTGYDASTSRRTARKHEHKDDDFYAEKAVDYLEALRRDPRRPLAWLEEQYRARRQRVGRATLRDWVHGARVRGFLTTGTQGRAGAEGTDKLEAWAKEKKRKIPRRRQR
jgi:hypothetical protein